MINKFYYNQDTLCEDLKEMRRMCNMTQREVANEIKVTRNAITQYEKGIRTPDLKTLSAMLNVYGYEICFEKIN